MNKITLENFTVIHRGGMYHLTFNNGDQRFLTKVGPDGYNFEKWVKPLLYASNKSNYYLTSLSRFIKRNSENG